MNRKTKEVKDTLKYFKYIKGLDQEQVLTKKWLEGLYERAKLDGVIEYLRKDNE